MLPVAHVGHWLWALYLPPVAIVVVSIARSKASERRERRRAEERRTD
jgi:tellurite resistance protein TehA-like permease